MSSGFQPRFGLAAEEFQRYRPDYPPELFEHILSWVPGEHRDCAMDLGAGTGKSARWAGESFFRSHRRGTGRRHGCEARGRSS